MGYLYNLILNNRGLIEKKVAELYSKDQYLQKHCRSEEKIGNIIILLINLFFEFISNENYQVKAGGSFCPEHFLEQAEFSQIQSFIANRNDYETFNAILKFIKIVIKDIIFKKINDNSKIYKCIIEADDCFDLLQLILYKELNKVENTDTIMKRIFELTPFAVFIFEGNNFIYANTIGEKLSGYSNAELKNMSFYDLLHIDYYYISKENEKSLREGKGIINNRFECKFINKSGLEVWIDISAGLAEINGKECILVTALDINELKRQAYEITKLLDKTLEHDKIKTEFFSNLSHELRTPLNVILGSLQLMDLYYEKTLDTANEKVKKYCKIMKQNCYRLLRLVNNLIDLSKLDSGYMKLNMNNHDIIKIVSMIASSVTDYIENHGINFYFDTKIDAKVIACDPDSIERIILNLLSNSVKFTNNGGMIQVKLWDNENSLFIAVKDTGIGISKEKQALLFKRFMQVDKSMSKSYQGSGIGLSLVKSLVELHGGNIKLISEEKAGCEFIIELPVRQIVEAEVEAKKQKDYYNINNRIEVINIEFADIYS